MQDSNRTNRLSWEARILRSLNLPHLGGTSKGTSLAVLKHVAEYCRLRDGECWASQQTMAAELGLSEITVRRALKALTAAGLVTCDRRSRGHGRVTHNHYTVCWSKLAKYSTSAVDEPIDSCDQPIISVASNDQPVRQERSENSRITTTTTLNDSLKSIAERLLSLFDSLFDRLDQLASRIAPPAMPAPAAVASAAMIPAGWQRVIAAAASKGVRLAQEAATQCQVRGEDPQTVLDRIRQFTGSAKALANHLIHGAALPAPRPAMTHAPSYVSIRESIILRVRTECREQGIEVLSDEEELRINDALAEHGLAPIE